MFAGGLPILVKTAVLCHNEENVGFRNFWRGEVFHAQGTCRDRHAE